MSKTDNRKIILFGQMRVSGQCSKGVLICDTCSSQVILEFIRQEFVGTNRPFG